MKVKYLIGVILILGIGFQFFRVNKLNDVISVSENIKKEEIVYTSSENIPKTKDSYLILKSHIESQEQDKLTENLKEVFRYSKTRYEIKTLEELNKGDIQNYKGILIATLNYKNLLKDVFYEIKEYVKDGGSLIILVNSRNNPFNEFSGIVELGDYKESNGIKFNKKIFPGLTELPLTDNSIVVSTLDLKLNKASEIIATTADSSTLIFETKVGDGRVIYSNSMIFLDRFSSGLLIQLISYSSDYFIQSIINTKLVNIDDFPAPFPDGKMPIIFDKYKMETRRFFKEIWWPEILEIAKKSNLIYTGFIIGTYEDITDHEHFSTISGNEIQDKIYFGRQLLSHGGEIGIHGYNHQPLGLYSEIGQNYDYKNWKSREDMNKSMEVLVEDMNIQYKGIKPRSYAPPSNIIGKTGKETLKEVVPSIDVLAGLYTGSGKKGVLITDIGWDKDVPSLFNIPRFSSGFIYNDSMMYSVYNGIAVNGIFHHFFHPDDILDKERGEGKTWDVLKDEFLVYINNVNDKFGFLRAQTVTQSFRDILKTEKTNKYTTRTKTNKKDEIEIYYENFPGKSYNFFRVRDKKIKSIEGGKIAFLSFDGTTNLYFLEVNKNKIKIILE